MRHLQLSEVQDQVSAAKKKDLTVRQIVNPSDIVMVVGDGSWTQDGREDMAVSSTICISLLRSHSSNNLTDDNSAASFLNQKGTKVVGNPIVFGSLSTQSVAVMGTDAEPLFVISAAGRQTAKASEYLSSLLLQAQQALVAAKGDVVRAQGVMMANCDEVTKHFSAAEWLIIFVAGSHIRKPLVAPTYAAQFWVKVQFTGGKPEKRSSLEDAKRANIRTPSTFSVEAGTLQRLVRSYVIDDSFSEEGALRHAASMVLNPMAVGPNEPVSPEYLQQLYYFSFCCEEVRAKVDVEKDPINALLLFRRVVKKCFRPGVELLSRGEDEAEDTRARLTFNKMEPEDQVAALAPKPARPRREAAAPSEDVTEALESTAPAPPTRRPDNATRQFAQAARRLASLAQAQGQGRHDNIEAYGQQAALRAQAALLAYQGGDASALDSYPSCLEALQQQDIGDGAYTILLRALDSWDGTGEPALSAMPGSKELVGAGHLVIDLMAHLAATAANGGKAKNRVRDARQWVKARVEGDGDVNA